MSGLAIRDQEFGIISRWVAAHHKTELGVG